MMKLKISRRVLVVLFVIVTLSLVYAVENLLRIPQVTVLPEPATTTSACGGNLGQIAVVYAPTGVVRFDCPQGVGAFSVTKTGGDIPLFELPSGYTSLAYVKRSFTCDGGTAITLTSGVPVTLSTIGDFDLCLWYSVPPEGANLPSFTFTWVS